MTIYVKGVNYVSQKCSYFRNVLRIRNVSRCLFLRSKHTIVKYNWKDDYYGKGRKAVSRQLGR